MLANADAGQWRVLVRLFSGPAGCGKTHRCLSEIRELLERSPEGPPLVLLAPNQATYQLERQLLAGGALRGYTRLYVLSFERLARLLYDWLGKPPPDLLDEEGRVMVLRALLARNHKELSLYRASARLTGFAQHLSAVLREFQQNHLAPEDLVELAGRLSGKPPLALKLTDLARLLREYSSWLASHQLQDSDCLLAAVTQQLLQRAEEANDRRLEIEGLWVDGFAEFTAEELELLAVLVPLCRRAALTFCVDLSSLAESSWLSPWSTARRALERCQKRLALVAGVDCVIEPLSRAQGLGRFLGNSVLAHLESGWNSRAPFAPPHAGEPVSRSLRLVECTDPSAEVTLAAREILAYVQAGGRYRDTTILVRSLDGYYRHLQRVFARYEIPFFLDRRESMAHHPAAELTRSAVRTVALGWQHEDWFAALKTGLVCAPEGDNIDRLENEALARGWRGTVWREPLRIREKAHSAAEEERLRALETQLETLRLKLVAPFQKLAAALKSTGNKPTGAALAHALRQFWDDTQVLSQLSAWKGETPSRQLVGSDSAHETVWNQLNNWVDNLELAFADEPLPLREWLPILEAGLANLTIGLIPPALDQVLVGAADRSRNPESNLVLVLGMNEGIFPARLESGGLLTGTDREDLERLGIVSASTARQQLSRERHYAYLACTRSRHRLVLTCSAQDNDGKLLNRSPFLTEVQQLFPGAEIGTAPESPETSDLRHPTELVEVLARSGARAAQLKQLVGRNGLTALVPVIDALQEFEAFEHASGRQVLSPALAASLYGPVLRTSVSRMENFAACPFKFFIHSGLYAQERKLFELDARELGTFQHDVLALFHQQLQQEGKRWREITPEEARRRIALIAAAMVESYREGIFEATDQARFMAQVLSGSLQDFVEILVTWMRNQYCFDPVAVEMPFGPEHAGSAWRLDLGNGFALELQGRIDRVDLLANEARTDALCVVVDYKSSHKQLDPVLIAEGVQLQLLAYLSVLKHWPENEPFGVRRLVPAGVFYVNLKGRSSYERTRADALADAQQEARLAYRHSGRFDVGVIRSLDSRPDAKQGDQFNYRLTNKGVVHRACREPVSPEEFRLLVDSVESSLRRMGRQIFEGLAEVNPFKRGSLIACNHCEYQPVCRIDPWTHRFRVLKEPKQAGL